MALELLKKWSPWHLLFATLRRHPAQRPTAEGHGPNGGVERPE